MCVCVCQCGVCVCVSVCRVRRVPVPPRGFTSHRIRECLLRPGAGRRVSAWRITREERGGGGGRKGKEDPPQQKTNKKQQLRIQAREARRDYRLLYLAESFPLMALLRLFPFSRRLYQPKLTTKSFYFDFLIFYSALWGHCVLNEACPMFPVTTHGYTFTEHTLSVT